MSSKLKDYDPGSVIIEWDGVTLNEGIAAGTFVKVKRNVPTFALNVGGDGGGTRVRSRNISGQMSVMLRMGSVTHHALRDRLRDEERPGADRISHVAPMTVEDFSGTTQHEGSDAYISGWPEDAFSSDAEGNREWVFDMLELSPGPGSNRAA